jgi:hypothetical protein
VKFGAAVIRTVTTNSTAWAELITVFSRFQCAGCGEWNETFVDPSNGNKQSYVEDCQVCCKPNLLRVTYRCQQSDWQINASLEAE